MIKNNGITLALYLVIDFLGYIITVLISKLFRDQVTFFSFIIDFLIFLLTMVTFVWVGRSRLLKNQGSALKNLLSVSLILVIGLVIDAIMYQNQEGNPLAFYWSYIVSFESILNYWGVIIYNSQQNVALAYVIYSILPVLLIWIGIQWRSSRTN
ncbi:MAG: hypothetical protein JWN30_1517 [Bacilli bacterium]|nr:hypothetical protein [Bacilli bacterium]